MNRRTDRGRFLVMLAGIGIMGGGVALSKLSLMGNDPHFSLKVARVYRLGVHFSGILFWVNCQWFLVERRFGQTLIVIGISINWVFVGALASLCERAVRSVWSASAILEARMWLMLAGVAVLSLACALYQTADMGVAPYDALSIILSHRSGQSYFRCRMFTDSLCALLAFLMGGLIGPGTLVCAVGLGPFIAFFSAKVARRLIATPGMT